jgi:hypothetical protein
MIVSPGVGSGQIPRGSCGALEHRVANELLHRPPVRCQPCCQSGCHGMAGGRLRQRRGIFVFFDPGVFGKPKPGPKALNDSPDKPCNCKKSQVVEQLVCGSHVGARSWSGSKAHRKDTCAFFRIFLSSPMLKALFECCTLNCSAPV